MDQWPHIRRLANGAIDYDFYRRNAHALRLRAIAGFFAPKKWSGRVATLTILARLRTAWKP